MKQLNDYDFYSDFYFEQHEVGQTTILLTDIIKNNGILLSENELLSSKVGYPANIIYMSDSTFKLTWDLKIINHKYYEPSMKQIKSICEYFCIKGWEEEFSHYIYDVNSEPNKLSSQYNDVKYYTKKWVNYITFQNSRIILQFDLEKFKKTDLRKYKLQQLI